MLYYENVFIFVLHFLQFLSVSRQSLSCLASLHIYIFFIAAPCIRVVQENSTGCDLFHLQRNKKIIHQLQQQTSHTAWNSKKVKKNFSRQNACVLFLYLFSLWVFLSFHKMVGTCKTWKWNFYGFYKIKNNL